MAETDFIVVGGGIYGTAISYELSRAGASVTLLERNTLASGASGGPGKRGIRAMGRDSRELPLAQQALALWPELANELGSEFGYQPLGGLWLVESSASTGHIGLSKAHAQASLLSAHGIPARVIDRSELMALEGEFSEAITAAIYCEKDAIASQEEVTHAYARMARQLGADVREHATAVKVIPGIHPQVLLGDGSTLVAAKGVIVAANSYSRDLLEDVLPVPMWRMVPQELYVEALSGYQPNHLIGHTTRPLSLKPIGEKSTMISGGLRGLWDADADQGVLVEEQVAMSIELASQTVPALRGADLVRAGAQRPEGYMADGIPVVDHCAEGVMLASGWHGHGFAIAPALSKLIAEWLKTGERPAALAPFNRDRFLVRVNRSVS